jgi:hypothetical protein
MYRTNQQNQTPLPAFKLANSSCLKFRGAWQKKFNYFAKGAWLSSLGNAELKANLQKQWAIKNNKGMNPAASRAILSALENQFIKLESRIPKPELPILSLISSGTDHHLIAADFDELGDFSDYNELYREVEKLHCTVAFSASGKVKAFFPVQYAGTMNTAVALRFLEEKLPEELWSIVDKNYAALFTTRLTTSIISALSSNCPDKGITSRRPSRIEVSPTDYSENELSSIIEESKSFYYPQGVTEYTPREDIINTAQSWQPPFNSAHTFNQTTIDPGLELEELQFWLKADPKGAKKALLRILFSMTGLNKETGFNLPTHKLGREMGCSAKVAAKHLKFLREKGYLEIIDDSAQIGVKAYTYIAKGALKEVINRLNSVTRKPCLKLASPTELADGCWNTGLWRVQLRCFHLHQAEEFRQWAIGLPGAGLKDRPKQIQKVYEKMLERYESYRKPHLERLAA